MKPALFALILASGALTGCHYSSASAQVPSTPTLVPADSDPPSRVARISYLKGAVSMRLGGTEEWSAASLNRPLTSGDSLWSGEGGRVELQTGSASLRLDAATSVTLLEVGTNAVQVKVTEGTLSVHVRELDEDEEFEIDTPDGAVSLLRAGEYRVEVSARGPGTTIIARTGMAEITGAGVSYVLRQKQQVRLPGLESQSYTVTDARAPDAFDRFCMERNEREERIVASKRVSPGTIGAEDLDENGEWETDPAYGPIWSPRGVPVDWAPYRFGHWAWIEPWGWTWIDDARWGFAPFHYGRWVSLRTRWYWVPGPFHRRPIYAPALVVFIGGGSPGFRFHFSSGAGLHVAWFPLGPREVWFPPYRTSRRYVTNVNITHTVINNVTTIHQTNIARQRYINRGVDNAVTAVPEERFRRAEPVHPGLVRVGKREAESASIGGSAPPVAPTRESLGRGERRAPRPASPREGQPVVVNRRPPPAPVPFEERRPALDAASGRVPAPTRTPERQNLPGTRGPEYRQEPRRQPVPQPRTPAAGSASGPATAPPGRSQPPAEIRRDRQWEQRTTREEDQRKIRIDRERQQEQRARGDRKK